jgi:hypothetical protein
MPDPRGSGAQEHPHGDGERARRAVEVLNRAQLVRQHHEPEILGHCGLYFVAPVSELGRVERDSLDSAAGGVATLVIRVVIAPAGTPYEADALTQQEVDHLVARGEERLPPRRRRRRTDVADDVGKVGKTVLVRVRDAVGPHQRIVGQPDHAT